MNACHHDHAAPASALARDEVADLLERYPHVSDIDAKRILTFLRKGRHLDVGIVMGDESLKPHLDRFTADHSKHLRVGIGEGTAVVVAIVGFLTACWLAWEAIKPAALTV